MFGGKPVRNREYVTDARGFLVGAAGEVSERAHISMRRSTRDDADRLIAFLRAFGDLDDSRIYKRLGARRLAERRHGTSRPSS